MIAGLEKLLAEGKDSPELRFGLGNAYLNAGQPVSAAEHLEACLEQKPGYSAAWKLLGRAYQQQDLPELALKTYRKGISAAEEAGDLQAVKEMEVFARRLEKALG
ncbi:tetratricopeptide repeat protein [Motiliproteus sp. SC1-56]|uniref:tetratricopeptide repeat protein n=1 Tax=Motiliproteus sp. SC1-56 TaxID=2799565 RepID=UPI001A8EE468|nr:tetratricopeptide repeat protein [Motiliproteus sp. SC1-56]